MAEESGGKDWNIIKDGNSQFTFKEILLESPDIYWDGQETTASGGVEGPDGRTVSIEFSFRNRSGDGVEKVTSTGTISGGDYQAEETITVPSSWRGDEIDVLAEVVVNGYTIAQATSGKWTLPDDSSGSDGGSGSDGEDGNTDTELDLGSISSSCDISRSNITKGETVEVDVNIDGTSPDRNTYYVDITLLVNGDGVAEGTGRLTANGASGESFEVDNLPVGDNEIDFELSNVRES